MQNNLPSSIDVELQAALKMARQQNIDKAILLLEKIRHKEPSIPRIHNELGVLYYQQQALHKAFGCFQKAVEIDNDYVRALVNLGACHNDLKDNLKAIECYEKALKIDPKMADAWGNLGKLCNENREYEYAVYYFSEALKLGRKPLYLRGMASAYRLSGRLEKAKLFLQEAISLEPNNSFSHTALAAIHFYQEQYQQALQEYEWRWKTDKMLKHKLRYAPIFNKPGYTGQNLKNKTVLIHTEQGYGDCLLFSRFIKYIRPQVKRLVMWSWPGITTLLEHNFDIDFTTSDINSLPNFDIHIPLLSLPYHFDPQLTEIQSFSPYLTAVPSVKTPITTQPGTIKIGLAWGCDPNGFDCQQKKVPLSELAPLLSIPGTQFYSLQPGPESQELQFSPFKNKIVDLAPQLTDFLQTGKVIGNLDLVISVDTAVAHLAAAMGKPTWVLLKKHPDWRWHGYNDHPLWYPNAQLYSQYPLDNWGGVINRLSKDLFKLARQHIAT